MPTSDGLAQAEKLMQHGGVHPTAIAVFAHSYEVLASGDTGLISEDDLEPIESLPALADLTIDEEAARTAMRQTAVVKLNGGLGTSMGMDRAKSLVEVRPGRSFLDIIVAQIMALRAQYGVELPLLFMDSFRTQRDTLAALAIHSDLAIDDLPLDFRQNQEPKLRSDDLTPVSWPADPELEWCPPGHGDLYTALDTSGVLDLLLDKGFRYLFVSNSDNLGARPDPRLAAWFAASGAPIGGEYCRRTEADRKGGHLARRAGTGRLVLRESAQTRPEDQAAFGDVNRHRFFNSNNLWLDLRALRTALDAKGGVLGLPIIRNVKTVDPSDPTSPEVIQIETAMGAAIGVFDGAAAIEVDRTRFLPVKSTSDLLVLRSDAYELTDRGEVRLVAPRTEAPLVDLDEPYRLLPDFDARFPHGPPSLIEATRFTVRGDWTFGREVTVRGAVELSADGSPGSVPDGAVLAGRG
ncbi:UTP--glucose-1-phosphate uridylyltransferase [Nakamurella panacisegetis]|uniref:UTP--glucose-1-phosphate uridylyltransferase n=1 Tax=Nakamurella panacisegetis TaxID=1090615 RepID=A0A1H0Q3L8_9ACTN|nr:UTP--glucose-1-phosphate uridylyltransferase [Nakamurella panacisegetis]SDP11248.1 UTP--glucose-1-phosphate uridylyltransferase [Nakamurella panacisegetis]